MKIRASVMAIFFVGVLLISLSIGSFFGYPITCSMIAEGVYLLVLGFNEVIR